MHVEWSSIIPGPSGIWHINFSIMFCSYTCFAIAVSKHGSFFEGRVEKHPTVRRPEINVAYLKIKRLN